MSSLFHAYLISLHLLASQNICRNNTEFSQVIFPTHLTKCHCYIKRLTSSHPASMNILHLHVYLFTFLWSKKADVLVCKEFNLGMSGTRKPCSTIRPLGQKRRRLSAFGRMDFYHACVGARHSEWESKSRLTSHTAFLVIETTWLLHIPIEIEATIWCSDQYCWWVGSGMLPIVAVWCNVVDLWSSIASGLDDLCTLSRIAMLWFDFDVFSGVALNNSFLRQSSSIVTRNHVFSSSSQLGAEWGGVACKRPFFLSLQYNDT